MREGAHEAAGDSYGNQNNNEGGGLYDYFFGGEDGADGFVTRGDGTTQAIRDARDAVDNGGFLSRGGTSKTGDGVASPSGFSAERGKPKKEDPGKRSIVMNHGDDDATLAGAGMNR